MKRLRKVLVIAGLGVAVLTGWACSMDPFIVNEAPRPEGWPDLTPIDEVEVKQYPAYRAAQVTAGDTSQASDSAMFSPLFNHIKREDIAMTAPVAMTYEGDKPKSMAFLYRSTEQGSTGTDDADPRVAVQDVPGQLMASLGVRGRYTQARFDEAVQTLNAWLAERDEQWRAVGEPRYLGYNSPFIFGFLRYGEVQVPVEPVNP
ncbi:MAG: heme-binding protein [Phycisphaeraceae bacterium]